MSRNQKMRIYHGIPKSSIDSHSVFYASLNGTMKPELGLLLESSDYLKGYVSGITGYATSNKAKYNLLSFSDRDEITIDVIVNKNTLKTDSYKQIVELIDASGYRFSIETKINTKGVIQLWVSDPSKSGTGLNLGETTDKDYPLHVRGVLTKDRITIYKNGKKMDSRTHTIPFKFDSLFTLYVNNGKLYQPAEGYLSDLHISNIDRGSYFPTLPQDFIDGKAVIKPRFGQQTIKGDPLYSQTTQILVQPTKGTFDLTTDGYVRSVSNPELCLSDGGFPSGSKIKIKGLNGEYIGGVFDSDTALCRIVKEPNGMSSTVYLDSVDKLKVGDIVKFVYKDLVQLSNEFSVRSINTTNNSVELDNATNWGVGCYVIETTASSSSPIVKTVSGATVNGTWTGLGTNEATFTLGTNASLIGQDLVITYGLIIPPGNSNFTETPFTITKAYTDTGVELNPVSEIVIEDDFKGKILGDDKVCPHKFLFSKAPALKDPTTVTSTEAQSYYYNLSSSDLNFCATETTGDENGYIPHQIFAFNVVEMVESKLGGIPSADKIAWLRENVTAIEGEYYGYGVHSRGNLINFNAYTTDTWNYYPVSHTNSSTTKLVRTITSSISSIIKDNGFVYYSAFTNPSDSSGISGVYTDYVKLKIIIKVDSSFITLYTDNKRAREEKCNPILIQKETKSLMRFTPSSDCFITDCTFISPPTIDSTSKDRFLKDDFVYLTTLGSGTYLGDNSKEYFINCLNKLGANEFIQPWNYNNDAIYKSDTLIYSKSFGVKLAKVIGQNYTDNNIGVIPTNTKDIEASNYVILKPFLLKDANNIYLNVWIGKVNNNKIDSEAFKCYKLPNNPLIK